MPSIGLHLALTLFFLAACVKDDDLKPALLLLPFGLLSDLDAYIGVHRATLHNLFIIFVPLFVMIAFKQVKITRIKDRYFIFTSMLLAFHILLDAFYNGVFLYYPVIDKSYDLQFWFGVKETGLSALFTWIIPGNVDDLMYVITPRPSVPEIAIIGSGIELVVLIFAVFTFFLKYKENLFQVFYSRNLR